MSVAPSGGNGGGFTHNNSQRNNNKVNNVVVMHQIEKLLANVKMGRTTLNYGSHDSSSACAAAVILHPRAGKRRPRPRW